MILDPVLTRRSWLAGALGLAFGVGGFGAASSAAVRGPTPMTVHKDPNCGCCTAWAERMRATGALAPTIVEAADMMAVKTRLRVPPALASCHTTQIGGFVVEGHVPAADIVRLLKQRPKGVIGLAVPGMPVGSPGMEVPDGRRDPFDVIAFAADGRQSLFARHA